MTVEEEITLAESDLQHRKNLVAIAETKLKELREKASKTYGQRVAEEIVDCPPGRFRLGLSFDGTYHLVNVISESGTFDHADAERWGRKIVAAAIDKARADRTEEIAKALERNGNNLSASFVRNLKDGAQ